MPIWFLKPPAAVVIGPPPLVSGVTLADIERATAPRVGPYALVAQSAVTSASTTVAYVDDLISSISTDAYTDLYLLRRGDSVMVSNVPVAGSDRLRKVRDYDPATGALTVDRPWLVPPAATEHFELHHLNPTTELRPAVLAGLRRCNFEDRINVTLTGVAAERDLTDKIFWLARPDQLRRVQFTSTGATTQPADVNWSAAFEKGGHVWLSMWPDQYPNTLLVTALRPASSLVNGIDSSSGPVFDTDVLSVDLDYAAAAAHIEAWRLFPAKMQMAADAGFQASQKMASTEFTRVAVTQRRPKRTGWNLSGPFGEDRLSVRAR